MTISPTESFFCDNPDCARRISSERLNTIAAPWARRTQRLADTQRKIGLVAGGSAGANLCQALGCPAQRDLLLGLLHSLVLPEAPIPRVLGVDNWAKRKGQSYGTILVHHERECVIEPLPDRTPETLADWLRDHPGVEIVTRDRAEAYAQGIREGAPQALQVADRWHLLTSALAGGARENLMEAVTKIFHDHQRAIQQQYSPVGSLAEPTTGATPPTQPDATSAETQAIPAVSAAASPDAMEENPDTLTRADQQRRQRAAEAHALRQQGWTIKAVARHLDCHPKTIRRYLQRQLPLTPRRSTRATKLDDFKGYLLKRWNAGCHNARQLFRKTRSEPKGYVGSITLVRTHAVALRRASGLAPAPHLSASGLADGSVSGGAR